MKEQGTGTVSLPAQPRGRVWVRRGGPAPAAMGSALKVTSSLPRPRP